MASMSVRKIDGTPVDVDVSRLQSVAEVKRCIAAALGVDTQPFLGINLLNGACDVCNDTPLDSLDTDAGLCVVVVQGAPEWYPREKYMHNDKEVLQLTREEGVCSAEFVDGSSETVDAALFEKAVGQWAWTEVSVGSRVWAHPPEKPEASGGWTSFFTSPVVRRRAVTGVGACTGFIAGITGHLDGPDDNSEFTNAFRVAQFVGMAFYVGFQVATLFKK
jgi:hypothetical protein